MAGTILVIMVFGLMVSISTAYIKMVQTETQVQGMIDNSDRALDAAFSGVNFVIAVAQSQKDFFLPGMAAQRRYFTRGTPLGTDWAGIGLTFAAATYPNATGSDWFYLNESLDLFDYGETGSSTKCYLFRTISYPDTGTTGSTIQTGSYLIKSQGCFQIYSGTSVIATYTSQIIAQCNVDFNRKVIQLKRWRYMPFETNTSFALAIRY